MSTLSNELARAYSEIGRLSAALSPTDTTSGPVFTWKNVDYKALSVLRTDGNLFGAGGLASDNHLSLTVNATVFTVEQPKPEQMLTYNGREYRIKVIKISPTDSSMIIDCIDPLRAAGIIEREM